MRPRRAVIRPGTTARFSIPATIAAIARNWFRQRNAQPKKVAKFGQNISPARAAAIIRHSETMWRPIAALAGHFRKCVVKSTGGGKQCSSTD